MNNAWCKLNVYHALLFIKQVILLQSICNEQAIR